MPEPLIRSVVKEEPYEITQAEGGIVSRDVVVGPNRDEWQELYRYQVPNGVAYVFKPGDHFALYGEYLQDTLDYAFADDGGTFTDETGAANNATANDMTLLPATEAVNDAYYFGYRHPFGRLRLNVGTAGVGGSIVWEYFNGSAWATVPGLVDGTNGLTQAGTNNVDFTPPRDWARTTVNNHEAYWLRLRCTAANFTTQPLGTQAWINGGSRQLLDTDRVRIEVREPNEQVRRPVLSDARYLQVKEFQDRNMMGRLDLDRPVAAKEGYWIVVMVLPQAGIVDVSQGYFALGCSRIRRGF